MSSASDIKLVARKLEDQGWKASNLRALRIALRIGVGLLCGTTVVISQLARAQEAQPTDTVIRAAYCIPVAQGALKQSSDLVSAAEAQHAKAVTEADRERLWKLVQAARTNASTVQSVLDRLRKYLSSRSSQLDETALRAAGTRGEADWKASSEMVQRCARQCPSQMTLSASDAGACIVACGWDTSLVVRTNACLTPTWLPL